MLADLEMDDKGFLVGVKNAGGKSGEETKIAVPVDRGKPPEWVPRQRTE
jgi:hypothetical protein